MFRGRLWFCNWYNKAGKIFLETFINGINLYKSNVISLEKKKRFGHPRFYEIIEELADLHDRKNRDYATPENPLSNFTRVAKMCKQWNLVTEGYEPVKVALIYALKQVDAALKLLGSGKKGGVEGIPDRLRDIAVYAILAEILYIEESQKMMLEI